MRREAQPPSLHTNREGSGEEEGEGEGATRGIESCEKSEN